MSARRVRAFSALIALGTACVAGAAALFALALVNPTESDLLPKDYYFQEEPGVPALGLPNIAKPARDASGADDVRLLVFGGVLLLAGAAAFATAARGSWAARAP